GSLGLDVFRYIAADSRFDDMPLILETPNEALWSGEIAMLYEFAEKK
ncbi:MAG: deoxyribonuclease IV, partial [Mucinivorans sp.]